MCHTLLVFLGDSKWEKLEQVHSKYGPSVFDNDYKQITVSRRMRKNKLQQDDRKPNG